MSAMLLTDVTEVKMSDATIRMRILADTGTHALTLRAEGRQARAAVSRNTYYNIDH